jgi:hypothetical protein
MPLLYNVCNFDLLAFDDFFEKKNSAGCLLKAKGGWTSFFSSAKISKVFSVFNR